MGLTEARVLQPGSRAGRYEIVGLLGSGGTSVVYDARDPELGRRVAVKVLHAQHTHSVDRLRREARALARLSHRHIVMIHDVGTIDDRLFVVVEHLDGGTLGDWLAAASRTTREIVARFRQAGAGLAAAHGEGLIHRDVKPANVMLGTDGRLRVVDFGLVCSGRNVDESGVGGGCAALPGAATVTGTVMGTPAYMAPEQHAGGIVDARADQYGFCVSLYEALAGERPNPGQQVATTTIPAWLRRVVLRGLATDPADRWPSMDALLAALDRGPRYRRRAALGAAGLAVASLAAVLIWMQRPAVAAPPCGGGPARLAGVWDPARRAAVERAFASSSLSFASDAWRSVAGALDGWGRDFLDQHESACRATRIHHDQPEDVLDRRMACLDRQVRGVAALVALLETGQPDVIVHAADAAAQLLAADRCGRNPSALPPTAAIPPGHEADVAAVTTALADVRAQFELGRYTAASERLDLLIPSADATDHSPTVAEARWLQAMTRAKLHRGDTLEVLDEALIAAEAAHDDWLIVDIHDQAAEALGLQSRYDDALRRTRLAEAAIARLGGDDRRTARLDATIANVLRKAGRITEGLATIDKALAIDRRLGDADATRRDRFVRANLLTEVERYEKIEAEVNRTAEAEVEMTALIDDYAAARGSAHPDVAMAIWHLADVKMFGRGEFAAAEPLFRRALAMYDAVDPEGFSAGIVASRVAWTLLGQGRLEEAQAMFEHAMPIVDRTAGRGSREASGVLGIYIMLLTKQERWVDAEVAAADLAERLARLSGSDHPRAAISSSDLCYIRAQLGKHVEAIRDGERALAVLVPALGEDKDVADAHANLGLAYRGAGRLGDAAASYLRGLAIYERVRGPDSKVLIEPLVGLAAVRLDEHHPGIAVPLLERAVRIAGAGSPVSQAEARFALAQALVAAGRDRQRARALAIMARDAYAAAGRYRAFHVAEIDAWLTGRQ